MKNVNVVAAVICDSLREKKSIFATARGYGEFKGQWEFPGGKIEAGETSQQALVREIQEELDIKISVGDLIGTIEYDYPTFHVSMDCFWCEVIDVYRIGGKELYVGSDGNEEPAKQVVFEFLEGLFKKYRVMP